ncbi:hypothetical protein PIB30_008586 [Stylosanthes scabra]|uniref:DUF4283 domain-containing protein n=1 Tax=Stylosanthes scabra TaxID=79078 RepID=A0ABU6R4S0_9FABA|nr:hypothetical protein [Stylosanthes scabra]
MQRNRKNRSRNGWRSQDPKARQWDEIERKSHTIFVDSLPHDRGAERAVEKLHGTFMGTVRMKVKHANFHRREGGRMDVSSGPKERELRKSYAPRVGAAKSDEIGNRIPTTNKECERRKSIEVRADPIQSDILKRSLMAESVETIRFGWIKEQIAEKWEGPGEVECRDLGPFKCILTFESMEARDIVFESQGLNSLFFELRPLWRFTRNLSRRVWLEVMGIPVHLWSNDTMMKIGKLWGKPVMTDELMDYYLSYTCASILVDSFQWEFIHEWVVLDDGERRYEVYVKEFGREMYSAQAHPGVCHESSLCKETETQGECNSVAGSGSAAVVECFETSIGGVNESYNYVHDKRSVRRESIDVNIGNGGTDVYGGLGCEVAHYAMPIDVMEPQIKKICGPEKIDEVLKETGLLEELGVGPGCVRSPNEGGGEIGVTQDEEGKEESESDGYPPGFGPQKIWPCFVGDTNECVVETEKSPICGNDMGSSPIEDPATEGRDGNKSSASPKFLSPLRESRTVIRVYKDGGIQFVDSEKKLIERKMVEIEDIMGRLRAGMILTNEDEDSGIEASLEGVVDLQ